jgi:Mrp family chromosome partitioning ATPase/uncharacterized protein involved in exopolysaccharide biosynthesis
MSGLWKLHAGMGKVVVANDEIDTLEPGILAAVRRFWWLPILGAVVFLALALAATALQPRPTDWTAEANLVVQDPSTSGLFANSYADAGRYVENQVAFLGSSLVAEQAATLASADAGTPITAADITKWLTIDASAQNDVIRLVVAAPSEKAAIATVNAVSQAYQDVRLSEAARDLKASLDQLDTALAAANSRLSDIEAELARLTEPTQGPSQTGATSNLMARLNELQTQREAASGAARDNIDSEINAIASQLAIYQTAQSIQYQDFTVSALTQEQSQLISQVSTLEQRRDELTVDSALSGSGVILDSRAVSATAPPKPETSRNSILGTGFGLVLGFGAAYFLALRRRRFDHRSQPESVLGAPLLADVPLPGLFARATDLAVLDAPDTPVAEAHRFLAAALLSRSVRQRLSAGITRRSSDRSRALTLAGHEPPHPIESGEEEWQGLVIAVVSASAQDGKPATVADAGIACLMSGANIALVDAGTDAKSITDILRDGAPLEPVKVDGGTAILRMNREDSGAHLDLLTARDEREKAQWLTSAGVDTTLDGLRPDNDVILVDIPPVLSSAYATTILSAVDGAVVMIPHLSGVAAAEDLRDMLALVGTPVVGYVYSRRPARSLRRSARRRSEEQVDEG